MYVCANMLPTFNSTLRNPVRNTHAKHRRTEVADWQHFLHRARATSVGVVVVVQYTAVCSILITIINVTFKHSVHIIIISYIINNIEYKYIIITRALANGPTYTRLTCLYYYYRWVYIALGTIATCPFVRTISIYNIIYLREPVQTVTLHVLVDAMPASELHSNKCRDFQHYQSTWWSTINRWFEKLCHTLGDIITLLVQTTDYSLDYPKLYYNIISLHYTRVHSRLYNCKTFDSISTLCV